VIAITKETARRIALGAIALCGLAAGWAVADEAAVKQTLQGRFPGMVVDSVKKAPFAGLYEVILDGEIVYTDEKVEYFFSGSIYDIRTLPPRNLTQDNAGRMVVSVLTGARDSAIKRVKGDGKRTLYTFEDPNCGYCKQLSRELIKIDNVTIYTFLLPILSQDSVEKSRAVWCAEDRAQAWENLMLRAALPENARNCTTPIERNRELMRRFGIRGTPAIYLEDGRRIGGYLPAAQIEQALNSVAVQ
jgi:thiol:disulfide interchange protein DsbC